MIRISFRKLLNTFTHKIIIHADDTLNNFNDLKIVATSVRIITNKRKSRFFEVSKRLKKLVIKE